ncbi:MAG: hypothetical protein P8L41_12115 [Paracoccaceae bacterium]|nr:hypothetical protein [Paracoccaceae bacterium]
MATVIWRLDGLSRQILSSLKFKECCIFQRVGKNQIPECIWAAQKATVSKLIAERGGFPTLGFTPGSAVKRQLTKMIGIE